MKNYVGNIVATFIGCGLIVAIPVTKFFHYGMSETWNIGYLAIGVAH